MADTLNYGWTKPTVAGDNGAWGSILNTLFDDVDTDLAAVAAVADASFAALASKLATAGGTMTGRLDQHSATDKLVTLGAVSGAVPLDLSAALHYHLTVSGGTTISVTGVPTGSFVTKLFLRISGGGSFAVSWPVSFVWPTSTGNAPPAMSVGGDDIFVFATMNDGVTWRCILHEQFLVADE